MKLERILINKKDLFDFKNSINNDKDVSEFYRRSNVISQLATTLEYLRSNYSTVSSKKVIENLEIELTFSDGITYMISIEDSQVCLESIFKEKNLVYAKFSDGTFTVDKTIMNIYPKGVERLAENTLCASIMGNLGSEIWRSLNDIYLIDLSRRVHSLSEIEEQLFDGNREKFKEILNEILRICNFNYDKVSDDLSGYKLGKDVIPFKLESSGIRKLSLVYPLIWLSKEEGKTVIFYGEPLDNSLHPILMKGLLELHGKGGNPGLLIASLCHTCL